MIRNKTPSTQDKKRDASFNQVRASAKNRRLAEQMSHRTGIHAVMDQIQQRTDIKSRLDKSKIKSSIKDRLGNPASKKNVRNRIGFGSGPNLGVYKRGGKFKEGNFKNTGFQSRGGNRGRRGAPINLNSLDDDLNSYMSERQ